MHRILFHISFLLPTLAVTLVSSIAQAKECAQPVVLQPAMGIITEKSPEISWTAIPGADYYRVQVSVRVPEGMLLSSLDTQARKNRYRPPLPQTAERVLIVAKVAAHCPGIGFGPASDPDSGGRFLFEGRDNCRLAGPPKAIRQGSKIHLDWIAAVGAKTYEITRFDPQSGIPRSSLHSSLPNQILDAGDGPFELIGVRPICNDKAGLYSFVANY